MNSHASGAALLASKPVGTPAFTHCGPDTVTGVPSVKRVDLEGTISNPGAVPKPKLPCNRVPGHVGQFDIARCIAL